MRENTTVCALSTPRGKGGIAVIRISGEKALEITEKTVKSNKKITEADGYTIVYGKAYGKEREIDEVLVSVFRAPNSFTGENVCEISCHGSNISVERIIDSYYDNPREMKLFFYYPNDEYLSYLMTEEMLMFEDEIDCRDLFEGENEREKILIFVVG